MTCVVPDELTGFGTLLQYKDPITTDWVTVGGTQDLEFPADETDEIETTANDSSSGYRQYIPSPLSMLAEVEYEMNFRSSQWLTMANMKANKTITDWRIVLQNESQTYMQFCAWIRAISGAIPMEDLVKANITLRPTGAPTRGNLVA